MNHCPICGEFLAYIGWEEKNILVESCRDEYCIALVKTQISPYDRRGGMEWK